MWKAKIDVTWIIEPKDVNQVDKATLLSHQFYTFDDDKADAWQKNRMQSRHAFNSDEYAEYNYWYRFGKAQLAEEEESDQENESDEMEKDPPNDEWIAEDEEIEEVDVEKPCIVGEL
ncbi:unnamed protein product [Protopolystoma xenopodis]|uniref:Uncharacterized protein n=1 Tax=Protopolystoma xenopodis TaxID=117903 RepID=A0A3S5CKD9_9PLAT|nr:unnamed protein product [Protopolystoma xenopodis]